MNKSKRFYYWLDPLRALSAILVLFVHARCVTFTTYGELESSSQNIFTTVFFLICGLGGFSVCMFYILSGFLVGGQTIDKIANNTISVKKYALTRFFRISVPLFGAIILIYLTNSILGLSNNIVEIIGQFAGLQCIVVEDYGGVFWTLPYEIWFYISLFAIACIVRTKHKLLGTLIFGLSLAIFSKLLPEFLYVLSLGIASYFLKDVRIGYKYLSTLWCLLILSFFYTSFLQLIA